jgi:hypothetical protein
MVSHSLVIGYHGCDIEVARKVISLQEPLKPSQNAWDWLDTIHGFFMEGHELYADAGFRELDHIQICVRVPKQIIGCFWPRPSP